MSPKPDQIDPGQRVWGLSPTGGGYPDIDDLSDEYVNVQDELVEIEKQMAFARDSSRDKLERKMRLVASINRDQQQVTDTVIALDSFEQLKRVYESDIARLESIEESGFLLGLNGDDCPVCGAALEHQVHKQVLTQIEASRAAAEIEIAKVSPLITYRDPIGSKGGALAADEEILKGSDLRDRMFRHLGSLGDLGQLIVFDNTDPPANADQFAQIQVFTNNAEAGRQSLL